MIYANFHVSDPESDFLSGSPAFQKVHIWNLVGTCHGEFLDAKIFPEKFCPVPGFAINRSFMFQ